MIDARERELQAQQREAMGDKAKRDLATRPAFKAELRNSSDSDGSTDPFKRSDPFKSDPNSTNPFDRLRQKSDLTSERSVR